MTDSKELYKLLSEDFKKEKNYSFVSSGEGMIQGREKDTRRAFLINTNTLEAWEILTSNGSFSFWDRSDIEMADTFDLPNKAQRNAVELRVAFHFGINGYKDGVASVSWTLQPDGRYYADEDGFGMENDEEIVYTAYMGKSANIIIPFQQMDWYMRAQYREQAVAMSKNPEDVPYICLSKKTTIPPSENYRLGNHKELLLKIVYGIMEQFGAQTENAHKHDDYEGRLGIFRSINPTPDNFYSITLMANKSESNNEKYEVSIIVGIFKEGKEPLGTGIMMGEYFPSEIVDAMTNEDNAVTIYNEFIQTVDELEAKDNEDGNLDCGQ